MDNNFETREYPMSKSDYDQIILLAKEYTSIFLDENKKEMIYSRFSRRIRALNIKNFTEYLNFLKNNESSEKKEFVNIVTTNVTSFFRENYHFEFLRDKYIPKHQDKKSIRVWSAGCSSGEEAYSIALCLLANIKNVNNVGIEITCTDVNTEVLEVGRQGRYSEDKVSTVPTMYKHQYFNISKDDALKKNTYEIKPEVKKMLHFSQMNLLGDWSVQGKFDLIFCRNVIIYFDKITKKLLLNMFADYLHEDGLLFLGHSENATNITDRFKYVDKTIYGKEK